MKALDATLDYMENARFKYLYANDILKMMKETEFSENEVRCVAMIYHKFVMQNGDHSKYMNSGQLCAFIEVVFNITDAEMNTSIVKLVSKIHTNATDPKFSADKHITLIAFIKLFAKVFTVNLERRMKFAFFLYDRHKVGYLSRELVQYMVKDFFKGDDEDEVFELRKDFVDLLFSKFDLDKDQQISFDEYAQVVRAEPNLLEFLGRCFPSPGTLDVIAICGNLMSHLDKKDGIRKRRMEEEKENRRTK